MILAQAVHSMASAADAHMTFAQRLVLWLHIGFAIFTIGPVTLAIMSTPRYIRQRNAVIVRYLSRITFIFMIGALVVLVAGFALAGMLQESGKPWIIIAATLFVVAILLLGLIVRDQRKALRALEAAGPDMPAADGPVADGVPKPDAELPPVAAPAHVAQVERSRIAMLGGVVSLIWLAILVLMVWNS